MQGNCFICILYQVFFQQGRVALGKWCIGLNEVCVRTGVRYVITKFSGMDSLPNFPYPWCSAARALRARGSSAIKPPRGAYLFQAHLRGRGLIETGGLKGLVHDNAHARRLSVQNKFVGSTLNSKSPLPVQTLKILRFIRTSVALAGLVIFGSGD